MRRVKEFFREIDERWPERPADRLRLRIIGCGALMLQTSYERGTKDSDVFDAVDLAPDTTQHLRRLAGRETELAKRRLMYVDIVANGVPFLPHGPLWHSITAVNEELQRIEILALDVVDVVVSKLKTFRPNDKADIDAMVQRDLVPHGYLVDRFRSAADDWLGCARCSAAATWLPHEPPNPVLNQDEPGSPPRATPRGHCRSARWLRFSRCARRARIPSGSQTLAQQ